MARITINLREFNLSGSILDISYKGSFIIPEMIETYTKDKIDKEFLECEDEIACTVSEYDNAVAILSFNSIATKKKLYKIVSDIKNSLIKGGRFVICDLNLNKYAIPNIYKIILKLPNEKMITTKYILKINPFRPTFKDVVDTIEKCGFEITKKKVDKGVYYIECLKE